MYILKTFINFFAISIMKLNLDLPIFVFYINVENLSKSQAQGLINQYTKYIRELELPNVMYFAVKDSHTRLECIYNGRAAESANKLIDWINKNKDFIATEEALEMIRKLKLDYIIYDAYSNLINNINKNNK